MAEKIFVDTCIFINLLLGKDSEKIAEILENNIYSFFTCFQVLNEIKYIMLIQMASAEINSKKKFELIDYIKKNKDFRIKAMQQYQEFHDKIISSMTVYLTNKEIDVESNTFIVKEGLLPSDAIIAITMKKNDIKKIFSSDADFEKIEGLDRIYV
jgi:predicted nucleic acid-binding protein